MGRLGGCRRGNRFVIMFSACRDVSIMTTTRTRLLGRGGKGFNIFSCVMYSRTRHAANTGSGIGGRDDFAGVRGGRCMGNMGHLCVATAPHCCGSDMGGGTRRGSFVL